MIKFMLETILGTTSNFLFLLLGWFIAKYRFGKNFRIERLPKKIIISEQMTKCEALGGRYSMHWDEYDGKYREYCDIPSKSIKLD